MMRLLKRLPNGDIQLTTVNNDHPPPYAILSHTWTDGQEVTYNELVAGTGKDKTSYAKIRFCVDRAAADGLDHCWVDTCCIDKSNQQEVQTAINSMFRWYQTARKCYVYLSDVQVPTEVSNAQAFPISWMEAFRRSRWFTRGWTLQELLAPASVGFFSQEGQLLGTRISLEDDIQKITRLPVGALRGHDLTEFSVHERISWTAERTTKYAEDRVYCLLGMFGVFLPLIYGEGEKNAMRRLKEEIQKQRASKEEEGEECWSHLVTTRIKQNRCKNCGSHEHWERECKPRQCGKCKSPFNQMAEMIISKPPFIGLRTGHTSSYCDHAVRCYKCEY
jgi:predicted Zn-ribbon and HTH transcriptional regulator